VRLDAEFEGESQKLPNQPAGNMTLLPKLHSRPVTFSRCDRSSHRRFGQWWLWIHAPEMDQLDLLFSTGREPACGRLTILYVPEVRCAGNLGEILTG